ncbi:MAG TPA: A24 family peptidase [Polyangiales bacterium]
MPLHHHDCFVGCTLVVVALAAFFDTRTGRIPNLVTLPPLAAAPLVHGLVSGPGALGGSFLGAVLCAAVPALLFVRGGMGGGDVKLFAALGALLGTQLGLEIELGSLWLAALCVCARLAWHGQLFAVLGYALHALWWKLAPDTGLVRQPPATLGSDFRLGAAIGCATLAVLLLDGLPWLAR